jgi:hypothetical protein
MKSGPIGRGMGGRWFTRTYLKIEKPHSIGQRSRETQSRDRDISKDSAVCS